MNLTQQQYKQIANECSSVFESKTKEYGLSWFCMRDETFAQQLYMKIFRIRNIQDTAVNSTGESLIDDFKGIFNYCLMWLSKITYFDDEQPLSEFDVIETEDKSVHQKIFSYINSNINTNLQLLAAKNGNYSDMWRRFSTETITDLILVKVYRLLQLVKKKDFKQDLNAMSVIRDIANYAVFAIINSTSNHVKSDIQRAL